MDFEYIVLQKYLRESFPEHAELTLAEILVINSDKFNFIDFIDYKVIGESLNEFIIENLFMIDIKEFFERNKKELPCDFINENSFEYSSINDVFYFNLQNINTEDTGIFLEHNLYQTQKNSELFIIYKGKQFKYNKSNFDSIMLEFISDTKKSTNPENLFTLFLYEYIKHDTDLTDLFHITLLNNDTITIATHYNLFYLNESNNPKKNNINIECANNHIFISDYNSNVLLKKELQQITKYNFFNEIIEPLKNIIIDMDNIRKEQFQTLWKQDLYHYLSLCLFIDKQELDVIQIKVFQPEIKSKFLDLTPHTTRPKMEILFLLNNNVASSCLIDDTNKYNDYYKEILDSYNIYKSIEEADSERMELSNIIDGKEKEGPKIKRI